MTKTFDGNVKFERFSTRGRKGNFDPYAKRDGKRNKNKVARGKSGRDFEEEKER